MLSVSLDGAKYICDFSKEEEHPTSCQWRKFLTEKYNPNIHVLVFSVHQLSLLIYHVLQIKLTLGVKNVGVLWNNWSQMNV